MKKTLSLNQNKRALSKSTRSSIITYAIVIIAFAVFQTLSATGTLSNSLKGQLVPICAYIVMALSLNLTVGVLGELSLGHAGFMSIGAFTGVVISTMVNESGVPGFVSLIIAMLVGGIIAGVAGIIIGIPVLRLRGDYLAIVTLAFGEIIKTILNCIYLGFDRSGLHLSFTSSAALGLDDIGVVIINGPMGAVGITKISSFLIGFLLILLSLFVILNFINSRAGRAVMAIRDNRIAAESVGISVTKYKMMAFVISAMLAGMAGALYGLNFSTIVPNKFNFNTSILVLVFVVLGGMGNMCGSIIAAAVLTVLPELLRGFEDYRMLIYAIVLILVMLARNSTQFKALFTKLKAKLTKNGAGKVKEDV